MGSEMCIRDSHEIFGTDVAVVPRKDAGRLATALLDALATGRRTCLLYTSDAADERSSVDLGGRRIIKKKTIV